MHLATSSMSMSLNGFVSGPDHLDRGFYRRRRAWSARSRRQLVPQASKVAATRFRAHRAPAGRGDPPASQWTRISCSPRRPSRQPGFTAFTSSRRGNASSSRPSKASEQARGRSGGRVQVDLAVLLGHYDRPRGGRPRPRRSGAEEAARHSPAQSVHRHEALAGGLCRRGHPHRAGLPAPWSPRGNRRMNASSRSVSSMPGVQLPLPPLGALPRRGPRCPRGRTPRPSARSVARPPPGGPRPGASERRGGGGVAMGGPETFVDRLLNERVGDLVGDLAASLLLGHEAGADQFVEQRPHPVQGHGRSG
jgi:hypothetical protein